MTGVVVPAPLLVESDSATVVVIATELTTLPPTAELSGRTE